MKFGAGFLMPGRGPGLESPFLNPPLFRTWNDTDIAAGSHLTLTTCVGFMPLILPPRVRVLRGFIAGDVVPASASSAGFQVQLHTMDELTFAPGTMIGETGQYNLVGTGALVDTADPPYWGLPKGSGAWFAPFTPPAGWQNDSYHEPRYLSVGVQLQGGGAYSAGEFYSWLRNEHGPSFLKLAADQSWAHTFTDNPTVTSQAFSDFEGRPAIRFQVAKL